MKISKNLNHYELKVLKGSAVAECQATYEGLNIEALEAVYREAIKIAKLMRTVSLMRQVGLSVESTWQWLSPMHWVLIKICLLTLLGSRFIMRSYFIWGH